MPGTADILSALKLTVGWKSLRAVFLVLLGGGFLFLLVRGGLHDSRSDGEGGSRDGPRADEDIRMEGIDFKEWKDGVLVWILDAREGKYYHGMQEGVFDEVGLTFVSASGGRTTVFADRVVYELDERALRARGNVRGENDEGYRFHTDSLFCDVEKREVRSQDKVVLTRNRFTAEGIGMEGSMKDQSFFLLSGVKTVFSPDTEGK